MSNPRMAMIGCGYFATFHVKAWRRLGVDVAAVCDLDEAKARAFARRFDVPLWFTSAPEMLRELQLDFVDIVTTMPSHRALVTLCADARLPVIVQKPFAPTFGDCEAMVADCAAANVPLMVHENFRFQSSLRRVREVLDTNAIGSPLWGRISFRTGQDVKAPQPYLYDEERFIILDLGVHLFDVARFFLGDVETVFCRHRRVDPRIRGEDIATVVLGHTSGVTCVVDFTYESRALPDLASQTLVTIEGTTGAIALGPHYALRVTENQCSTVEDVSPPLTVPAEGSNTPPFPDPTPESVYHTQAHWLECLRSGREPETNGRDSLHTYAIVDAAYESARTGQAAKPSA